MEKKVYGLLGRTLGHSWSVPIHKALGCADYRLIELEPDELQSFLRREDLGGLNVTMPYKQDVMRRNRRGRTGHRFCQHSCAKS